MVPAVVCPLLLLPLLLQGDFCTSCGAPFQRSFVTFEVLPLVEFQLEAGISDAEALALLGEDVLATTAADAGGGRGMVLGPGQGGVGAGANVLQLDGDGSAGLQDASGYGGALEDAFSAKVRCIVAVVATFALRSLLHVVALPVQGCCKSLRAVVFLTSRLQGAVPHMPIVLGRAALRRLRPGEVCVRRWPNPCLPVQWFRLLDEDQPVVVGPCGHFFEAEEFEMVSGNWSWAGLGTECCTDSL